MDVQQWLLSIGDAYNMGSRSKENFNKCLFLLICNRPYERIAIESSARKASGGGRGYQSLQVFEPEKIREFHAKRIALLVYVHGVGFCGSRSRSTY